METVDVKLNIKPVPVPLIYQPIYKLILLLAILKYANSKPYSSAYLKLHLYMWGFRSKQNFDIILELKEGVRKSILPWSFEPGLEKTITTAIINEFCDREIKSNELKIRLTDKGLQFIKKIEDSRLFEDDFGRVKQIGIIPQNLIQQANKNWKLDL